MIDIADPSFDPLDFIDSFDAWCHIECCLDPVFVRAIRRENLGKLIYSYLVNTKQMEDYHKNPKWQNWKQLQYDNMTLIDDLMDLCYPNAP